MSKRGRPALGITKKVSLTLTEREWAEIEASGLTVAAFLKEHMKEKPVAEAEPIAHTSSPKEPVSYPRRYAEERWEIYLSSLEEAPPADVIEAAKTSMFKNLYPNDAENVVVRTREQYECPFTGKRYSSVDKLIRAAIPHLIESTISDKKRQAELAAIRKREKAPKYLMDIQ